MEWQGRQAYAHIILEITREREEQDRLEMKAYSDTLTSIGNRSFFIKRAKEVLESGEAFVICYCDLDHLKYINDSHGHAEGDIYICSFVECAQQFIREEDIFARLGGDEFCIIFRDCYQDAIEQRMSEIRQAFSQGYSLYSKSFSYGLVQVPGGTRCPLAQRADGTGGRADVSAEESAKKRAIKTENRQKIRHSFPQKGGGAVFLFMLRPFASKRCTEKSRR